MVSKKYLLLILIAFVYISGNGQTEVMSFNIRYDNPNDGENWWENRKEEVAGLIEFYHPEFIGIQEGMDNQVQYLDKKLQDYAYIGFGRNGKGTKSEAVPIFYDSTKYELIDNLTFWLSETPEVISKGWDASLNRISTYGAFRNKATLDTIYIFNCHFDHKGEIARKNSSKAILDKIDEYDLIKKKVIVMGDLNCLPKDEPYKILSKSLDDAMKISSKKMYGPKGTWNGFDTDKVITERIDYIFCSGMSILTYRHIDDRRNNNLYISDHLPIIMETK